jgi:hypothetical protein
MADVVFGATYNLVGDPRFRYVCEAIDESNVRVSTLIQAPSLAGWKLDKYVFPRAIKARNRFVKFVSRVVKERMEKMEKSDAGSGDLFSNLITAKDPETGLGFSHQEIGAESTTLIVAGRNKSFEMWEGVLLISVDTRFRHNFDLHCLCILLLDP